MEERLANAKRQLRCDTAAVHNADGDPDVLTTLLERAETSRERVAEVRRELRLHEADRIPDADIRRALIEFNEVCSTLWVLRHCLSRPHTRVSLRQVEKPREPDALASDCRVQTAICCGASGWFSIRG